MAQQAQAGFLEIHDRGSLDEIFERSKTAPVILFKHSITCPISSGAYEEMSRLSVPVSLIIVQKARELSREIESRTGIRHESPQVIILRDGKAVWSASHWDISSTDVEAAARAND
jgi:bacillithiol system protein YtxJ